MNDWQCDLVRYGMRRPFLKEQSIWAVWLYRQGRRIDLRSAGLGKKFQTTLYWLAFRVVETTTGVSLPKSATIGPGLRIWHFGSIFIHPDTKIGANCTLRQGVTIGNRHADGPVPVLVMTSRSARTRKYWVASKLATTAASVPCQSY